MNFLDLVEGKSCGKLAGKFAGLFWTHEKKIISYLEVQMCICNLIDCLDELFCNSDVLFFHGKSLESASVNLVHSLGVLICICDAKSVYNVNSLFKNKSIPNDFSGDGRGEF